MAASIVPRWAAASPEPDRADGPVVRAVGWLPIIGRTSDAIRASAESAVSAADATIVLADAASEVPGGTTGLAPAVGGSPWTDSSCWHAQPRTRMSS